MEEEDGGSAAASLLLETNRRFIEEGEVDEMTTKTTNDEDEDEESIDATTKLLPSPDDEEEELRDGNVCPYFIEDWKFSKSFFLLIGLVGIGQGMMNLARLAIQYFYKDELEVGPDQMQAAIGAAFLPWMIKPLYAFLSDSTPILGERRKPYIVICSLISIVSWVGLACVPTSFAATILVILCCSASFAFINVVAEALIVEKSAGRHFEYSIFLLTIFWSCTYVSEALCAYFGGKLLEVLTTRQMFLLTACAPLIILLATPFLSERPRKLRVLKDTTVFKDKDGDIGPRCGEVEKDRDVLVSSSSYRINTSAHVDYLYVQLDDLKHKKEEEVEGNIDVETGKKKKKKKQKEHTVCCCCTVVPEKVWNGPKPSEKEFWIPMKRISVSPQSCGSQAEELWHAFFSDVSRETGKSVIAVWKPTLYMLLWYSMPSLEGTMFFFYTNELNFSEEFMGGVELTKSLSMLLAIIIFNLLVKCPCVTGPDMLLRPTLLWGTILSAAASLFSLVIVTRKNLDWNIDDQYFAVADTAFIMGFGTFAFFPLLAVAIRMCPVNCEATVYATVMAAGNLGTFIAAQLGALITYLLGIDEHHFDNLWILVIICSVSKLLPLFTLWYLTPGSDADTSQGATTKITRGKRM
jgi:folate/biopterin transporter